MTPQAIQWPEITVSGRKFTLRCSYASLFQLAGWGKNLTTATWIEMAASAAGHFLENGTWRSEGFLRVLDFVDLIGDGETDAVVSAAHEAAKKAFPEVEFSPPVLVMEVLKAMKTDGSTSGPSELQAAA